MSRLAEVMQQKRITADVLAASVGLSRRTVYRHVRGQTAIDLRQAAAYAKALEVNLSELVEPPK